MFVFARNRSLKKVITLATVIFIFIPTMLFTILTFWFSSNLIQNKVANVTVEMLDKINRNLEKELSKNELFIHGILNNGEIIANFEMINNHTLGYQLKQIFDEIPNTFINLYIKTDSIYNIVFVPLNTDNVFVFKNPLHSRNEEYYASSWYQQTLRMNGKINWLGLMKPKTSIPGEYIFAAALVIKSGQELTSKNIGVLFVSFKEHLYRDIFSIQQDERVFVTDSQDNIVIPPEEKYRFKNISDVYELTLGTTNSGYILDKDRLVIIAYSAVNSYGWRIVKEISFDVINKEIHTIRNFMLIGFSLCIMVFLFYLIYIYKNISRPIKQFNESIIGLQKVSPDIPSDDVVNQFSLYELNNIARYVSSITDNARSLEHRINVVNKNRDFIEIEMLQAQINPHFLYNILNSIKFMSMMGNADGVEESITSLIKLLKSTINRTGRYVTVEEEIEYLKNYITIQNRIYDNKIDFVFRLNDNFSDCIVPNFFLQPIVENAIFHGIDPSEYGGRIIISNEKQDSNLVFIVEDNGKGMPVEKIKTIFDEHESQQLKYSFSSIGLCNIQKKLKLMYGDDYGININSTVNVGTKISIRLPFAKGSDIVD